MTLVQLAERGCSVTLLISPKEVDQQAARTTHDVQVATLPAIGLKRGGELAFARGFGRAYRAARKLFSSNPPHAALAMGGFTSAPAILAAKRVGAKTFLHESNTIAGRANRWLSWLVDRVFVGFPSAATRLHNSKVLCTGTPVRAQFQSCDPAACREALGLEPARPVLLVMGGSQGARGINQMIIESLPLLARKAPHWQWFHLAGADDVERVKRAYGELNLKAVVHPFWDTMELALGAATAAISRAGASSLAELGAARVPAVLIPYPAATDNHQFYNAQAFEQRGAARLLEEEEATPERVAEMLLDLVEKTSTRRQMQNALAQWDAPDAAEQIAKAMIESFGTREAEEMETGALQQQSVA